MEEKTINRGCSSFAGGFADIREIIMLLGDEGLVYSLTRLRDLSVERGMKDLSLAVYDPNRGRLHPRELFALIQLIVLDVHIKLYLLKKNDLSVV